ncbi:flagellar hook-length control protein FliK [Nocardioides daejeonensis]|uniref:flagellar hook-length control protein FliK n=1 Tax=Nocardioides daejeonensis TaxID=1046556 RepID=UPI000D7404AA|nr:flagellar hook-length control protein FliK [Nocardioides daejeonensis]
MTIQPLTPAPAPAGAGGSAATAGSGDGADFPDLLTALLGTMVTPPAVAPQAQHAEAGAGSASALIALLGGASLPGDGAGSEPVEPGTEAPDTDATGAGSTSTTALFALLGLQTVAPVPGGGTVPDATVPAADAGAAEATGASPLLAGLLGAGSTAGPAGPAAPGAATSGLVASVPRDLAGTPTEPGMQAPETVPTDSGGTGTEADAIDSVRPPLLGAGPEPSRSTTTAAPRAEREPLLLAMTGTAGAASDPATAPAATSATTAATTAAVPPPVPAPPAASGGVPATALHPASQQVLERISHLPQQDGTHRLTIKLQPEALGEVRVVLSLRHGEVQVRITAGEAAAQALGQDSPELRRLLEQAGMGEARIAVRESGGSFLADTTYGGTADRHDGSPAGRHDQLPARTPGSHQATEGTIRSSATTPDPVQADPPRAAGLDLTI